MSSSVLSNGDYRNLLSLAKVNGGRVVGPKSLWEYFQASGIGYAPLGADLGGRREPNPDSVNTALEDGPFRDYADHMGSDQFEAGLAMLEDLAAERRTAIMCAEADWTRCHRRLIADALTVRGWRVLHLGPDGSLAEHELDELAVVDGERVTYPEKQTSLGL